MAGFAAAVGVLGLLIGSFVNVVAFRVPRGEPITGRSRCPSCGRVLTAPDLVPVVSWLALRGHCRHCRTAVSWAYPAAELACAALFVAFAIRFEATAALVAYLVAAAGLLALSIVDLRTMRLPNRILGPLTGVVVVALAAAAAVDGDWAALVRSIAAGAATGAAFAALHFAAPRTLGFGDVKLAVLVGVLTGWVSWGTVLLGLFLAVLLGAAVGVAISVALRTSIRGRRIPFGPFLAGGALLAVLVGEPLLDWYTGLIG